MSKYSMLFALYAAMGCAVTPAPDAGSSQSEISDKVQPEAGSVDTTKTPEATNKGNGYTDPKAPGPSPDTGCGTVQVVAAVDKLVSDQKLIDPLVAKTDVPAKCPATTAVGTSCAADLAAAQENLDAAIKSGDAGQIAAAKAKYAAIVGGCTPPVGDLPPSK